jgi:hypothetical protein
LIIIGLLDLFSACLVHCRLMLVRLSRGKQAAAGKASGIDTNGRSLRYM